MADPWIVEDCGPLDMTDADYHNDPAVGGSLSSSGARTLATSCPAMYAYQREHGRPDTPTLEFGRAYHGELLGTGAQIVEVKAKTWTGKAVQEAAEEARAAGAVPLLTKDVERIRGMVVALRRHPIAGPLFARPGRAEQSFFARDPDTEVMCRARVDWMPDVAADGRVLVVDAKTTRDAHPVAFAKSMATFGYHQQGPFYSDVLSWLGRDHGQPPRFVLVAQEKEPPYLVTIAEPDEQAIEWGRELNRRALRTYARCTERGEWPGYEAALPREGGGIARLALPGWQVAQYEAAYDRHHDLEETYA